MNRKNLTAAVLAGLAGAAGIVGSAQAVNVNPDGLGQVLLYPYYTVNGGNQTILSVVNTSDNAKAVKVRFLEGQNSREVLDFNMYMSAYDVWTAALVDDGGVPTMITNDTTCTVPYIFGNGGVQPFLKWALTDEDPDGSGYGDVNTRGAEGHFEIIEMGTMIDAETTDASGNVVSVNGSAAAATHAAGTPANCAQLVSAWTRSEAGDGYWITDPFADLTAPSGGLFGGAAIVNPTNGTMYSYDAKAINGFADSVAAADITVTDDLHQEPGTIFPSLDSGNILSATVFADDGTLLTSTLTRGVDAISYVLMHDQIMNEYTTEAIVAAGTEWVVTFPTKQFYVHQDFLDNYATFRNGGVAAVGPTAPVVPFTSTWTSTAFSVDASGNDVAGTIDRPCEVVIVDTIWDREEAMPAGPAAGPDRPPVVSPRPPGTPDDGLDSFPFCFETQVVAFRPLAEADEPTAILGSNNNITIDNAAHGFEFGWARIDMTDGSFDEDQDGTVSGPLEELVREPLGNLLGLPSTGFAVQRFENGFAGEGTALANYGGIFSHKGTRMVSNGSD